MNNENKNVFEETVKTLTQDAMSLQRRFHSLQEKNDFRGALDTMRLLKDTLALIKEYDWELKYSEYQTDGHKEVSVWEQNHSGEIRNHKKWTVSNSSNFYNIWLEQFEQKILCNESFLEFVSRSKELRGTGKSYTIAKMCDKYDGCVVVGENKARALGVQNNSNLFGFNISIITYDESKLKQYNDKIFFIDENSGLTSDQVDALMENHLVVGFI